MKPLIVSVVLAGLLILAVTAAPRTQAQPVTAPEIVAIAPNTAPNDRQTAVTLTGVGFVPTATARLGDTPLLDITVVDSTTIAARVPFGLAVGPYTLTVTTTDPMTLTHAFTVTQGTLGWASGGPYGGQTQSVAVNPAMTGTVYVSARLAGLFRTTDGGNHWNLVFQAPLAPGSTVAVWPVDPDVVFFTGNDGLYRSDQRGDPGTWTRVSFPAAGPTVLPNALAIAAGSPTTIYCAVADTVFHSADGGFTWEDRGTGLPREPNRLAVDPHDARVVYASYGDEGTLYKTTNAGRLWAQLPYSIARTTDGSGGIESIATDPYRPDTVWLGSANAGLFRSGDGGQTFVEVSSLVTVGHQSWIPVITFDPNRDRIYLGTIGPNDAIHVSDDGGATWRGLGLNNQGGQDIAVAPGDGETLYTTWSGVRKSTDAGQTWSYLSEGIAAIQPERIAVSPHDPHRLIATAGSDGAFGSHNGGNTWERLTTGSPGASDHYQSAVFDPLSPTVAYLGGGNWVHKTTDDGRSWQATSAMPLPGPEGLYGGASPFTLVVHPQTQTRLYAGVGFQYHMDPRILVGAVYTTEDGGGTWSQLTTTGAISPVNRIAFAPSHPETFYLGMGVPEADETVPAIWRTSDGGETWHHPDTQLNGTWIRALTVHPDDPDVLLTGSWTGSNDGSGIYYTMDGARSWTASLGLETQDERKVLEIVYDPQDPRIVYAATHAGMRVSFNGGLSWQSYPGPFGSLPVTALEVVMDGDSARLYIGTVGGTVGLPPLGLQAARDAVVLNAGVYAGRVRWHTLHLPVVLRDVP